VVKALKPVEKDRQSFVDVEAIRNYIIFVIWGTEPGPSEKKTAPVRFPTFTLYLMVFPGEMIRKTDPRAKNHPMLGCPKRKAEIIQNILAGGQRSSAM